MNLKKMTLTGLFATIAIIGSTFSVPVFGAKCAPVQHMINILCAVFLGPGYGIACAFIASFIRNLLGIGTLLAFPGSMCGALLAGYFYQFFQKRWGAYLGEVIGTAIIGGMLAFPVAAFIMGNAKAGLFTFVMPFFISTCGGTICAIVILEIVAKTGLLAYLKGQVTEQI